MISTRKNPRGGQLFTVSAPSGAGKTSLVRAAVAADAHLQVSVSHTTRPMRPGEINGQNYHFVDQSTFLQARDQGDFFEWAEVFGNLYGTSRAHVEELLGRGNDVILEIDWQGARQVKAALPECCTICIIPPSVASLQSRLNDRGQDDDNTIARRMAEARGELAHCTEGDFLILNEDFDTALQDLLTVIQAQRLRTHHQRQQLAPILRDLLEP